MNPALLAFFFLLPFGLFGLICTIFWIWMLVDCIQNERLTGNDRIIWVLVILFLFTLGALIYFLVGRKK